MKFDTSKSGLHSLFKPYQAAIMSHLFEATEPESHEGALGSGALWGWVQNNAERLGVRRISRASVIFFLNDMVDAGFLKWRDATGKGGHHRLYSVALGPKDFAAVVSGEVVDKLDEVFTGEWWRLRIR